MNKVILMGRPTRDPEIRYTASDSNSAVARYTLAVDRKYAKDGQQTADFINCIAFGKNAEFAEKYVRKGVKISVVGRLQTGSYEKDGVKHYTTDVIVEEHDFCEKKSDDNAHSADTQPDGFMNIPDGIESELPFV